MRKVQSWILIGVIALLVIGFRAGKINNIAKIETKSEATSLAAYAGKIRKEIKVTAGAEIKLDLVYPAAGK